MSVLKPKAADKTRTLSVRLSADLLAQVEALRADAEAAGLVFDVADLVSKSLASAVKAGRLELSAICIQTADSADALPAAPLGRHVAPNLRDAQGRDPGGANDRREAAPADNAGA